jgi:hypothetical protein
LVTEFDLRQRVGGSEPRSKLHAFGAASHVDELLRINRQSALCNGNVGNFDYSPKARGLAVWRNLRFEKLKMFGKRRGCLAWQARDGVMPLHLLEAGM